ncbi:MAG TPA: hypothetical protein VG329_02710 [Candidatus Dormibacteraeota bacterium]|nr:hypothetical protein [Candidatus Dormibacteraeota bacterium]
MRPSATSSSTTSSSAVSESTPEDRAPVELPFWRTLYRYLLSIVASLAAGFIWLQTGAQLLKLNVLGTMFTGVAALAVGVIIAGYMWLSIDLSRPVPEGVDEQSRNYQLFILWIGMPLLVIGVCALVALVAVVISSTVLSSGLPGQR